MRDPLQGLSSSGSFFFLFSNHSRIRGMCLFAPLTGGGPEAGCALKHAYGLFLFLQETVSLHIRMRKERFFFSSFFFFFAPWVNGQSGIPHCVVDKRGVFMYLGKIILGVYIKGLVWEMNTERNIHSYSFLKCFALSPGVFIFGCVYSSSGRNSEFFFFFFLV